MNHSLWKRSCKPSHANSSSQNFRKKIFSYLSLLVVITKGLLVVSSGYAASPSVVPFTLRTNLVVFRAASVNHSQVYSLGIKSRTPSSYQNQEFAVPFDNLVETAQPNLSVLLPFNLTLGDNYFSKKDILETLKKANVAIAPNLLTGSGITLTLKETFYPNSPNSSNSPTRTAEVNATKHQSSVTPITPTPHKTSLPVLGNTPQSHPTKYMFYATLPASADSAKLAHAEALAAFVDKKPLPVSIKLFRRGILVTFYGKILKFHDQHLTIKTPFKEKPFQGYAVIGKNLFLKTPDATPQSR